MFLIGLNYWSKGGGPLMWRFFNEEVVDKELAQIRELGVDVIRAFVYWPDFQREPGKIDEEMLRRLGRFLDLAHKHDVGVFLTFVVGHMSGENWDPQWKGGRDFFELRNEVKTLMETVVSRFRGHPAIRGWILSNELPIYATSSEERVTDWIREMSSLIKSLDGAHWVSTGDGCWGIMGAFNGFNPYRYRDYVDYMGPHFYTPDTDAFRHTVMPQLIIKACRGLGKPTILEEFGASSTLGSDEHIAGYYRVLLAGSLVSGAVGAWGWCYSDFPLTNQRPYSHHPHELRFGVTTVNWEVKPQGNELTRFSRLVSTLGDVEPVEDPVALLIPSYVYWSYPFTSRDDARRISAALLASYSMLVQNGLNPRVIIEEPLTDNVLIEGGKTRIGGDVKVLFLPCALRYLAQTQEEVRRFVENGGVAVVSYCYGFWMNIDWAIKLDLYYNYPITADGLSTVVDGVSINVPAVGYNYDRAIARVSGGEVLLKDSMGNPVIAYSNVGAGRVYFITYPIEYWLGMNPKPFENHDAHLIYSLILRREGFNVQTPSKWVQVARLKSARYNYTVYINHSWSDIKINVNGINVESGERINGEYVIKGKDYLVLRT